MDDPPSETIDLPGIDGEPKVGLFKKITGHRFAKQLGRVFLYLGLSRVISVAGTAWATRCLGPEKLGISGMIVATVGQMMLFVSGGLESLFIRQYKQAATDDERHVWVSIVMSQRFFFSLVLGVAGMLVAWALHPPAEWWLGIFAALPIFVIGAINPSWVNVAQEDIPTNFKAVAVSSIFASLLYFLFFRRGQITGSDLVVQAAASLLQFVILARTTLKGLWPLPIRWSFLNRAWPILAKGRWLFASTLLVYIYTTLEVPMLGYLSSLTELGKYRVATNLVNSAQQVLTLVPLLLFPRFVEWQKQGADIFWRKQLRLAAIFLVAGLPVCGLAFLFSPAVFRLLYGAAFASVAIPFAILFASKLVAVVSGVFSYGLWAQAEDKKVFWVMLPTAVVSFICNLLLLRRYGTFAACSVNFLSEIMVLAGCFILARRHVKQSIVKEAP